MMPHEAHLLTQAPLPIALSRALCPTGSVQAMAMHWLLGRSGTVAAPVTFVVGHHQIKAGVSPLLSLPFGSPSHPFPSPFFHLFHNPPLLAGREPFSPFFRTVQQCFFCHLRAQVNLICSCTNTLKPLSKSQRLSTKGQTKQRSLLRKLPETVRDCRWGERNALLSTSLCNIPNTGCNSDA